jgi:hypothetical protein
MYDRLMTAGITALPFSMQDAARHAPSVTNALLNAMAAMTVEAAKVAAENATAQPPADAPGREEPAR